jgi:hypothetical protein
LSKHLGVTFNFAGEKENLRLTHLLAQVRGIQMPEESDIVTVGFLRARTASDFFFARSCQAKLPVRKSGGFPHQQIRAFVSPERTGKQDPLAFGRWARPRKVISAVDAIVDGMYIHAAKPADRFRHVPAIARDRVAFPNGAPQQWTLLLFAFVQSARDNIRNQGASQIELLAQRHKGSIEGPFPWEEINVGTTTQYLQKRPGRIRVFPPRQDFRISAIREPWIRGARAMHNDAVSRGIEARNHFLHGEVLRVAIVLVGKRRREDCDRAR